MQEVDYFDMKTMEWTELEDDSDNTCRDTQDAIVFDSISGKSTCMSFADDYGHFDSILHLLWSGHSYRKSISLCVSVQGQNLLLC